LASFVILCFETPNGVADERFQRHPVVGR
jgi:hypothetical protein